MNNIELELFDMIARAVNASYSSCSILNTYRRTVPAFPCVMFYEADNFAASMDGSNHEIATGVMYEVQVFSAKEGDSKTEVVDIMQLIDSILTPRGFRRTSMTPAPNLEDATVYRLVARYSASISDNTIYRR